MNHSFTETVIRMLCNPLHRKKKKKVILLHLYNIVPNILSDPHVVVAYVQSLVAQSSMSFVFLCQSIHRGKCLEVMSVLNLLLLFLVAGSISLVMVLALWFVFCFCFLFFTAPISLLLSVTAMRTICVGVNSSCYGMSEKLSFVVPLLFIFPFMHLFMSGSFSCTSR